MYKEIIKKSKIYGISAAIIVFILINVICFIFFGPISISISTPQGSKIISFLIVANVGITSWFAPIVGNLTYCACFEKLCKKYDVKSTDQNKVFGLLKVGDVVWEVDNDDYKDQCYYFIDSIEQNNKEIEFTLRANDTSTTYLTLKLKECGSFFIETSYNFWFSSKRVFNEYVKAKENQIKQRTDELSIEKGVEEAIQLIKDVIKNEK